MTPETPVARLSGVNLLYGKTRALQGIDLEIPAGVLVGLIGPDGVGKSSLLSLLAGARAIQEGRVEVLGGDMSDSRHRNRVCPNIAYMPQGLGKNLYPTLSVEENLQFFGRLFGHNSAERRRRIDRLTAATGLYPFLTRPAGQLSGGMKQKLGLCCALIHDPDLLILDEPTTGVDPLSRRQFWDLIARIRSERHGMSVIVATAYMDEAERFELLLAMDAGRLLAIGTPRELHERTGAASLEAAFIALLPAERRRGHKAIEIPPLAEGQDEKVVIEAHDLTQRFGDFTAVDHVNFRIRQGEIFGFLGSNGCGKTTTMKMLTGLLPPTEGKASLFGKEVDSSDIGTRRLVGYMSQAFSLYSELTVHQNLVLHARLFRVPEADIPDRVDEMIERFGLGGVLQALPDSLPLGIRQRLSLAVAMVHKPQLLILDEPTSGVDPIARDTFWELLIALSRQDKVTIFISTHFMNEGERCDRVSLMHAGRVLVSDSPAELVRKRGVATLEDAFIAYLEEAGAQGIQADSAASSQLTPAATLAESAPAQARQRRFSISRALSYALRETLELQRDPVRAALALVGSLVLMLALGLGINLDVDNLSFAVLDRDQTTLSQSYILDLEGSRYFVEHRPIIDYADLDRRMRSGELSLAIEIPPHFARDVERGDHVQIGVWMDGAMPQKAETVQNYVQGMHQLWLTNEARQMGLNVPSSVSIETRFRYNPDVKSVPAIVPAVMPLLLMTIPAMLAALSVVREKELGSIINLYVTPVTRTEFLLGKQLPYIAVAMLNFLLLTLLAVTAFGVPLKGSFLTLALAALVFVIFATGFGLFVSAFTRTQGAGMFLAAIGTMIPCIQFGGLTYPISALEGGGRVFAQVYPAGYFSTISRGVFNKALGFSDLYGAFLPMLAADIVILAVSIALLKKQET